MMKKNILIATGMLLTLAMLAGCGKEEKSGAEAPAASEATTEQKVQDDQKDQNSKAEADVVKEPLEEPQETGEEQTVTETASQDVGTSALPAYEYPGPELFYTVLYQYLIDEYSTFYDAADVSIPNPVILDVDESDKEDIRVYGTFWLLNYDLKGDTLECVSGGSYPGLIHVKSTDSGYEVTGMDVVADGSDFDDSARKIFGDRYDAFIKLNSDDTLREQNRAQIIANYVAANNLSIMAFQDYGWEPVQLPEENIDSFYSQLD